MFFERRMMMKKLLVLLMVLTVVSAANAALTWVDALENDLPSVDLLPAASTTVYVYSDTPNQSVVNWMGPSNTAVAGITGGSVLPAAGNSATFNGVNPSGYVGWGRGESKTGDPDLAPIVVGTWYEVVITAGAGATAGQSATIGSDYYGAAGDDDLLIVNIIPEPMTVALLGLGGLLLRRRK
jgi:hypothetical protein